MLQGACAAPGAMTLDPDSALDTTYDPNEGGNGKKPWPEREKVV